MKKRKPLPNHFVITRAILDTHWDPNKKRFSSDLFKNANTSVSLLKAHNLKELVGIYHRDLNKKQKKVFWIGQLRVGALSQIRRRNDKAVGLRYKVVADPLYGNPYHAEILNKSSRGVALAIAGQLFLYFAPNKEWRYTPIVSPSRHLINNSQSRADVQYLKALR